MEKIKIENLTFTYPGSDAPAVKDINLTVRDGEFVVLFGKSGCGKTTLLRLIKPSVAPHGACGGKVILDGVDVNTLSYRTQTEQIGFVFQNPDDRIVCDKVWHELAFGLENLGFSDAEIRARVAETAAFFGIQNYFDRDVSDLSGGQKQLLSLASVMTMRPSVLILDEPTSRLDPIAADNFLTMLVKINTELGTSIILSEHNLEKVLPLADRAILMDNGKISAEGTPPEIGEKVKALSPEMFAALPTPVRIYCGAGGNGGAPLTVRDGREWLKRQNTHKFTVPSVTYNPSDKISLELDSVYLRYEKDKPDVLNSLSLKVCEGEFYCIIGPNGAGKTTAVGAMCGVLKPYRGKVMAKDTAKIGVLWQNPAVMFTHKTVLKELEHTAPNTSRLDDVIAFCELENILASHPYDLSGGQQQRAALATVLLTEPDILILDEPTKGLDCGFKAKLAELIGKLKHNGKTVIAVSHDIEFCAKYADRCGMLFGGKIVSEGAPRKLFGGNGFYTTAASRMAKGITDGAVLDTDILASLGVEPTEPNDEPQNRQNPDLSENGRQAKGENLKVPKQQTYSETPKTPKQQAHTENRKTPKMRNTLLSVLTLLLMLATIFWGKYKFGDRKYYFISLLIIFEAFVPFAASFERRRPKSAEIVIISVMCALTTVGRMAFSALPQFKPSAALVIVSGMCLGSEAGFLIGAVSAFASNFFFVQGPWTPWQMFALGIVGFVSGILKLSKTMQNKRAGICIFGFLITFILYGGIMNGATTLMRYPQPNFALFAASIASGLSFDLIHAVSTAFFLYIAARPMAEKLERVKLKYGLVR